VRICAPHRRESCYLMSSSLCSKNTGKQITNFQSASCSIAVSDQVLVEHSSLLTYILQTASPKPSSRSSLMKSSVASAVRFAPSLFLSFLMVTYPTPQAHAKE
jgi:hypothetical protein